MTPDLHVYSPENLLKLAEDAPEHLGYKVLQLYVLPDGTLAKATTEELGTFYLSPSGGTLRDKDLNIVLYSAKFDIYKGLGKLS